MGVTFSPDGGVTVGSPVHLVPTKSDQEVADDLKVRFTAAAVPALSILDEALAAGFLSKFNIAADGFKRHRIVDLHMEKWF